MNISIAIADKNSEYARRLSEVLQQYKEFMIKQYTSTQTFLEAMEIRKEKFDIVLFDPDISESSLVFINVRIPICLYSDEAENRGLYADFVKVRKYQRVSRIYKEIMQIYAKEGGYSPSFHTLSKTILAAVYSPVGGSGKTTLALALASKMAGSGKRTLFVSMEQMNSSFCVNPRENEGITALLEAAKSETINFEAKLKGTVNSGCNGMLYIDGFERIVDYEAVTEREMADTLDKIRRCDICDIVVVDMESSLNALGERILEMADYIILVEKPGELPVKKTELFTKQVVMNVHKDKMVKLQNFAEERSRYCPNLDLPCIGIIHTYNGELTTKDMIKNIISNKEFRVDRLIGNRED